jgi:hypothetical protein
MERSYYIDDTGFIEYAGKFESLEEADQFMEDKQINSFWLFSESYLEDFIKFAQQTIEEQKQNDK